MKTKMRKCVGLKIFLLSLLCLALLPGCGKQDDAAKPGTDPTQTEAGTGGETDAPPQTESEPSDTSRERGAVKLFEYGDLSVEVTNVKEVKKGKTIEDEDMFSEYDIYVVYPGATATVKSAGTFVDEETGLLHANWAFDDVSADGGIDALDGMKPVEITQDVLGIYSREASVYVLGFEVYNVSE